MEFNKETLKVVGKAGLKVGKAIIIEGTKAVAVKGVTAIIMDGFSVKDMTVDKFISGGKVDGTEPKKEKKGFFKRKKKEDEVEMDIITNQDGDVVALVNKDILDKKLEEVESKED